MNWGQVLRRIPFHSPYLYTHLADSFSVSFARGFRSPGLRPGCAGLGSLLRSRRPPLVTCAAAEPALMRVVAALFARFLRIVRCVWQSMNYRRISTGKRIEYRCDHLLDGAIRR